MEERYNFFDAFNGFGAWLRTRKIPSSAILLYYALLQISNLAGRKNPINIPIKLLMDQTGLTAPTIRAARTKLKEEGLVKFEKTSDGTAPNYTICLAPNPENGFRGSAPNPENGFLGSAPNPENGFRGSAPNPENGFPILRVNNNRVNNNREKERKDFFNDSQKEAVTIFENQIHPISSISEKENVISLIEEYGAKDFIEATKEARKRNARTIHYIVAILRNWKGEGKNGNQRANNGVSKIKLSDDISEAVERKRRRILREIMSQSERENQGKASGMP